MKPRIGSILLYVAGFVFALMTIAPVAHTTTGTGSPYATGVVVGKVLVLCLAVAAFRAAYRMGQKAKQN